MISSSWDRSGGTETFIDKLGKILFGYQALHYGRLTSDIGSAMDQHPASVSEWNFNGPFGNALYYKPNLKFAPNWPEKGNVVLGSRLMSNADVLSVVGRDVGGLSSNTTINDANANLLTDQIIDELREGGKSSNEIKQLLRAKSTQFALFPPNMIKRDDMGTEFAGKVTAYGVMHLGQKASGFVCTDGVRFPGYRNRTKGKTIFDLAEEADTLVNPALSVNYLDSQLTTKNFNSDDRAIGAIQIE